MDLLTEFLSAPKGSLHYCRTYVATCLCHESTQQHAYLVRYRLHLLETLMVLVSILTESFASLSYTTLKSPSLLYYSHGNMRRLSGGERQWIQRKVCSQGDMIQKKRRKKNNQKKRSPFQFTTRNISTLVHPHRTCPFHFRPQLWRHYVVFVWYIGGVHRHLVAMVTVILDTHPRMKIIFSSARYCRLWNKSHCECHKGVMYI